MREGSFLHCQAYGIGLLHWVAVLVFIAQSGFSPDQSLMGFFSYLKLSSAMLLVDFPMQR